MCFLNYFFDEIDLVDPWVLKYHLAEVIIKKGRDKTILKFISLGVENSIALLKQVEEIPSLWRSMSRKLVCTIVTNVSYITQ